MTAPTTVNAAAQALHSHGGQPRAGGTDVVSLARARRTNGPYVDLHRLAELRGVTLRADGSALVGATTTIAEVAADPTLRASYPALAATAGALATPQVRAVATIAGNLLQRNRCVYYRNPAFSCFQSGGDTCPAREGDHQHAAVIDQGPCVAPHPSSMAVALLAYGATVHLADGDPVPVADLYDGADPTRDHQLDPGQLSTGIELPAPTPGETAAHHRATGRSRAEWPLVEVVVRIARSGGVISEAVVAAGAVARSPVRLTEVERELVGSPVTAGPPAAALDSVAGLCSPLPETGYKVELLRATVTEALERAIDQP
ncbi:xanthine dehydrogenase YagS FAD-binding subunit [Lipingzhangella halophila]|uniref:Xanthine dehydrogenase YagS FAD-binding subunit n=1 Tax=Lipingzhangella halophila TaxID=1783352 RepID=A0A7W7RFJ8_9ACTN|nr:FAD binding domain-containing protein [Lipingzhangella halophila]MBB4930997.1 xanthine dehydrogenase YagS FAD-binding subunit [Lipingzhangella halophila]